MAGLLAGLAIGACDPEAYHCESDDDCTGAGPAAYCHGSRLCAIEASHCPSGAAFADYSGAFGNVCVPVGSGDDDDVAVHEPEPDPEPAPQRVPSRPRRQAPVDPPRDDGDLTQFACHNGELDPYESDVDCGGPCQACATCQACVVDDDCGGADSCAEGECRETTIMVVDWIDNCAATVAGLDLASVELPPGDYVVRALPSAGAKWSWEESWGWFLDHCEGMDLDAMGQVLPTWFQTAQQAYDAIPVTELERDHPGGAVACGLVDNICADNRGGTIVAFERRCP